MDVIFTNAEFEEVGVLFFKEFDLAYGSDENDFEVSVPCERHCCKAGSLLYIEDTEYGGMVDSISVDPASSEVKYMGRTWHGILAAKVIEPDNGEDYLELYGDANAVLGELIDRLALSALFTSKETPSYIEIKGYQMSRYIDGYSGMLKMLEDMGAKLKMAWKNGKVVLWAENVVDYAQDEAFDSSVLDLAVQKHYHPVNHLICLGQGNLSQRAVIHLFTDEDGGVQPYALGEPLQDSDYLLDRSRQVLFGSDEVTAVYDCSNAETTENYILLTVQPDDWSKNYSDYYMQNDSDDFISTEGIDQTSYALTTVQPTDWSTAYTRYFFKSQNGFKTVEGVEKESYRKLSKKPKDWKKNYKNYFYYWSDGITSEYKSAEALSKQYYKTQTMKPSDWATNFSDYFIKNKKGKYVAVEAVDAPKWEKGKYYKKGKNGYDLLTSKPFDWNKRFDSYFLKNDGSYKAVSGTSAPKWKTKKYYTQLTKNVAPKWKSGYFYTQKVTTTAPMWKANMYYSEKQSVVCPPFKRQTYYEKVLDHYAELVEGGLQKLAEEWSKDEIQISLDAAQEYDVGDIIGATESVTGISVQKTITKKIVKCNGRNFEISYEVGEKV